MYYARSKHCSICNKHCSEEEHAKYVKSLKGRKLQNALLQARNTQKTLDEYGKWIVPKQMELANEKDKP